MSKTIVKSVLGLVYLGGKIVLVKRRDIPVWVLPGGGIDEGDSPEEAVIKEVKEETGYDAAIERKVALYQSPSKFIQPVYLYKLNVTSTSQDNFDAAEVKNVQAFSLNALPSTLVPFYIEWINDSLKTSEYYEKMVTSLTPWFMIKTVLCHPLIVIRYLLMRLGIHVNT